LVRYVPLHALTDAGLNVDRLSAALLGNVLRSRSPSLRA
jgi:hypothetical protein